MSSKVTDTDRGLAALVARAAAAKAHVRVGILEDGPKQVPAGEEPGELDLVDIAIIHEFGAPDANIPQRSFLRAGVDELRDRIAKTQAALARAILAGKIEPLAAVDQLGAQIAGWLQQRITRGLEPPLAPETVARKGSSKPLINTGQLRSAIAHKVEEG